MPRAARLDLGGYPYHVLNRSVMRLRIFNTDQDYNLFESLIFSVAEETGMRILAYCIMPNHWHLLLYPVSDGDLSRYMHRLTNAHTRKIRARTDTVGLGPLYQGRYKSFVIEEDLHFLTVLKYVERNAVRAGLSDRAETWRWGSANRRLENLDPVSIQIYPPPTPLPGDYLQWLNEVERTSDLNGVRKSVGRNKAYGRPSWIIAMTYKNLKKVV